MGIEFKKPLIIGDIDASVKSDISQIKQDIGDLSQLETADKSSLVNALNEAIDSTLNGASRDLDNLSYLGNDKLRSLNSYANEGELLTDADGLSFVKNYAHSTFDASKFTKVGSPNITDDGIASGFSSGNYLKCPFDVGTKSWKINFVVHPTSAPSSNTGFFGRNGNLSFGINIAQSNTFQVVLSSDGSTVDIGYLIANSALTLNTDNDVEVGWDETKYYIIVNNGEPAIISSTTPIYNSNEVLNIATNRSASGFYSNGSFDLKQLSITVDGVPVFSGNKTGIDTIKPDDYTVVGTPTISADGVASGFGSSNYLNISNLSFGNTDFKINFAFTTGNTASVGFLFCDKTIANNFSLWFGASKNISLSINNNPIFNITPNAYELNSTYEGYLSKTGTTYKLYYKNINNNVEHAETATSNLYPESTELSIGKLDFVCSIDLNAFKIYVDGNLVYQPCLKIPYTESKTGSKIVDYIYRDRVADISAQFGYANYYTLQDEPKGNYTVVGSPTISSDFVASGFSVGNYLQIPVPDFSSANSWEMFGKFRLKSTPTGQEQIVAGSASNPLLVIATNQNKKPYFSLGTSTGSGWQNNNTSGNTVLQLNTDYWFKMEFTGSEYVLSLSTDGINYNREAYFTSTEKLSYNSGYNLNLGTARGSAGDYFSSGSIDLKQFNIYVDNKLAYQAVTDPNFTLPQVELYGLIGQRTLRDSYRNGINYWELYSNRDLEQGGSCTSGVEVTFARPFADTNYVLSVPYSAKSTTAFTPTQTGDWIAKGKGLL